MDRSYRRTTRTHRRRLGDLLSPSTIGIRRWRTAEAEQQQVELLDDVGQLPIDSPTSKNAPTATTSLQVAVAISALSDQLFVDEKQSRKQITDSIQSRLPSKDAAAQRCRGRL